MNKCELEGHDFQPFYSTSESYLDCEDLDMISDKVEYYLDVNDIVKLMEASKAKTFVACVCKYCGTKI